MSNFHYKNSNLFGEDIKLSDVATEFGTPSYVYSKNALNTQWELFEKSFANMPHRICYAVKANSNISILKFFAEKGAGFDIVSSGELERVLKAGGDPKKIVFSGVGKKTHEIEHAIDVSIGCFNVESIPELHRLQSIAARKNLIAPIAFRINPNIDPKTHPYIATGLNSNKFGIEYSQIIPLCEKLNEFSHVKLIGFACHIGSQLTELSPFIEAMDRMLSLTQQIQSLGIPLQHLNLGGGLGVTYHDENPPSIQEYVAAIKNKFNHNSFEIFIEPGRVMVAVAGILLTRVEYLKHTTHKNFAIIDAGMNDLMRPSLYDAWHDIVPLTVNNEEKKLYDVVGPVCESGDFFGKERLLAINEGDLLAILNVGAYGFSMSSHYNSRPRPPEIMIDGNKAYIIRKRESVEDLFKNEL